MYGLKEEDLKVICSILQRFPEVEEALLYGSRAKGNYKNGSDIDLALKGKISPSCITALWGLLNDESPLPYFFDILSYEDLTNRDLKDHIDRIGISIYTARN